MLDRACPLLSFRKDKQRTAELNLGLFLLKSPTQSSKGKEFGSQQAVSRKANDRQSYRFEIGNINSNRKRWDFLEKATNVSSPLHSF